MLTFKQFLAEMQASNDDPANVDILRAYRESREALNRPHSIGEREFHIKKLETLRVTNPHLDPEMKKIDQQYRKLTESLSFSTRRKIVMIMRGANNAFQRGAKGILTRAIPTAVVAGGVASATMHGAPELTHPAIAGAAIAALVHGGSRGRKK